MDKKNIIEDISNIVSAIDKSMELDKNQMVISFNEVGKMREISNNLSNLKRKLEKDELEVAVVGLEKAGKSKFSSAFVDSEGLFPSADERCTFTSTKLEYSPNDYAEVEFYPRGEFTTKFEKMLNEVEFKNGKFDTIKIDTFKNHFETLKESRKDIYNLHTNKTEADIIDIIEGRDKISQLLNQPIRKFEDFKSDELKTFITDKNISRAVKNVTFYSSNLQGLENIVLYDVPGFDSPTQVHLNQTIEKLQDVDAIIMVKNIKMPSLKGGEVDILVKNNDMDGIKLYEKLFVFGSYADNVESLEALGKNKNFLIEGLSKSLKNQFASDRLFTGCLDKKYEDKLIEMGSSTELEKLKDRLKRYNQSERISILEKRINRAIEDVKAILKGVIDRTPLNQNMVELSNDIVLTLLDDSRLTLEQELSSLSNRIKKEIITSEEFTKTVKEGIEKEDTLNITPESLHNIMEKITSDDARWTEDYDRLNNSVRESLAKDVKDKFNDLIISISKDKMNEIMNNIEEVFLNSLGVNANHPKYKELLVATKEYIDKNTAGTRFDEAGFKALTDRFSVDLIETMIKFKLGGNAREQRFQKGKRELYMLSLFSAKNKNKNFDLPLYKTDLVLMALTQKGDAKVEETPMDKNEYISQIKETFTKLGVKDVSRSYLEQIATKALTKKIPLTKIIQTMLNLNLATKAGMELAKFIYENTTKSFEEEMIEGEARYISGILKDIHQANSIDGVKKEIEDDIKNLKFLFIDCVVEAICLELPFAAAITHSLDTLKNSIKGESFRNFVGDNVSNIKYDEYGSIEDKISQNMIKKNIVDEFSKILRKLEK